VYQSLKSLDTNLYENLESTFTQEYPNLEILLSVADESDPALPVARELIAKYPDVNSRIIIGRFSLLGRWERSGSFAALGEEVVGVNPKVNNLIRSYREATNDILRVRLPRWTSNTCSDVAAVRSSLGCAGNIGVAHIPFCHIRKRGGLERAGRLTRCCRMGKQNMRSDLDRGLDTLGGLERLHDTDKLSTFYDCSSWYSCTPFQ
jgi:hypothetical protein